MNQPEFKQINKMKEELIKELNYQIKEFGNGVIPLFLNKEQAEFLLQALSQSEDINIKQIAEDFYGTCENDITIEQYVQVFQDAYTAFNERGLFNSQSEGESIIKEIERRLLIVKSEPNGIVRETMLDDLLINLTPPQTK